MDRMTEHERDPSKLLGRRVATYAGDRPSRWRIAAWSMLILLTTVQGAASCFGREVVWSAATVVLAAILAAVWYLNIPRRVDLFQNGLQVQWGRRSRRVYWNQVSEVYQAYLEPLGFLRPERAATWQYRLISRDGTTLRLAWLEDIRDLGQRIEQQVVDRHLPMALDAYRTGYTLRFGRQLAVNSEGIHIRYRFIPWHDVAAISMVYHDHLTVTRVGDPRPSVRLSCVHIANLRILDSVLQAVRAGDAREIIDQEHRPQATGLHDALVSYASGPVEDRQQLLLQGFDGDDLDDLDAGQISLEELLRRGPRHRPRHPR
jgi:hypothetical protein